MIKINGFSKNTKQKLKNYVYVLTKQEENEEIITYVGKGKNDRVFEHFKDPKKVLIMHILFLQKLINQMTRI